MKIRNGFVSNSSSSSFIVAFPKKPKNSKDVLKFMFGNKEGEIDLQYYDHKISYSEIAETVFDDIEKGDIKTGTLEVIMDNMLNRYYYHSNHGNIIYSGNCDESGGNWGGILNRYYGSDTKLMDELKNLTIKYEDLEKELRVKKNEIIKKSGIKQPKWAYEGGIDRKTNKPYTKKDISAYEKYEKAMSKFKETNAEYVALDKELMISMDKKYKEQNAIKIKIAKIDANNFMDDNKGKYIFVANYGDEDGNKGALMEHGDIFRNVSHIKINNH